MDNNYTSQILEENSEQNQKDINSEDSRDSKNKNNNNNIYQDKIEFSINENLELNPNNLSSSSYLKENKNIDFIFSIKSRTKPHLIRLSNKIFNDLSLFQFILNYLKIPELNNIRIINHKLLLLIHEYYKMRIKMEIDFITNYQEKNKEKVYFFMKNIDTQIPISNKNWLDFDLNSVVKKVNTLNRNIINKLRSMKNININKISDEVFAPFCLIFSKNVNKIYEEKNISWKKKANQILSEYNIISKIQNLDIENIEDKIILEIFKLLNKPELEIDNIKKYSIDLSKLVAWCQGIVSYHIIIHPYIYRNRNDNLMLENSPEFNFILEIENMIEKFYKFKRFLYNLNIMKIPLADYVFNLQHNINIHIEDLNKSNHSKKKIININEFNIIIISNIFSYIPFNQSHKMMNVCKKFYEGFKSSIDLVIFEMIKEIYFFRYQSYKKIISDIPMIFSYNFFSKFFLMIDDILNSNCINNNEFGMSFYPFFTNEQLINIKSIKIKNEYIEQISKIFCLICNLKPLKKFNLKINKYEYIYTDIIKSLTVKGELIKIMRNTNKLLFNKKKIGQINTEIKYFINNHKLVEIKKISKGMHQLLIWELFVLLYLKIYNIFDFMNIKNIQNAYNKLILEKINYYIELMEYLKYYLKIKFHFSGGNNLNVNNNKNFDFHKYFQNLITFLGENNLRNNSDIILESTNEDWEKIGNAYFDSKNDIPFNVKPFFYERIMIEILKLNESKVNISNYSYSNSDTDNISRVNNKENFSKSIFGRKNNKNIQDINYINRINYNNIDKLKNRNNNNYLNNKISNNKKIHSISFDLIPEDIFIKNIFFYLDINHLPKVSLINHKYLCLIKTHFFIRMYLLKREKSKIEEENKEIFDLIKDKRKSFFKQYEIKEPSKQHALNLINQMKEKDFLELKQYFKIYNKNHEKIIIPFLLILGENPVQNIKSEEAKNSLVYSITKKIVFNPDFIKRIKRLELELLPNKIFKKVEKIMKEDIYSEKTIKNISPYFNKLINWILGILEFHRSIRKYSLSDYDYDILNKEEINFCIKMDYIILLYYKLNRYINNYCKEYKNKAKIIMKEMGIIN